MVRNILMVSFINLMHLKLMICLTNTKSFSFTDSITYLRINSKSTNSLGYELGQSRDQYLKI